MLERAKRASHIDPPASSYAIMRRARPYRGENNEPGKDVHGELDPTPGIRELPRPKAALGTGDISQCSEPLTWSSPMRYAVRSWLGQQMLFARLKRREFVSLLGGAAAWPLAAWAQQGERVRRIGVITPATSDDPVYQARIEAFLQGLQQLGWTIGRTMRIDTRWTSGNSDDARKYAAELVALAPDVILATGSSTVGPLLQVTRSVPIVFPAVSDPVAAGFVESLARPGGNATGFIAFEYSLSGKWPE